MKLFSFNIFEIYPPARTLCIAPYCFAQEATISTEEKATAAESEVVPSLEAMNSKFQQSMKELDRLDGSQMQKCILERAALEGWSKQRVFDEVSKLCQLVYGVPMATAADGRDPNSGTQETATSPPPDLGPPVDEAMKPNGGTLGKGMDGGQQI